MEDFKEVEIFIIGEFGLLDLHFSLIKPQLDLLIVNLVPKACQCGKQYNNLHQNKADNTALNNYNHINAIQVNFQL